MKTASFLPCALALAVLAQPASAAETASDSSETAATTATGSAVPAFSLEGGSASALLYLPQGAGPAGTLTGYLDSQANQALDQVAFFLRIFSQNPTYEIPKETSLSGTMSGFSIGGDLSAGGFGRFTVEVSGLTGNMDYDSGRKPFLGTLSYELNGVPGTAYLYGMMMRSSSLDIDRASILGLWRPAAIGDWFGAGVEFSHTAYSEDYCVGYGIAMNATMDKPYEIETLNYSTDFNSNDVLLHVRLGGTPFPKISAKDGKYGFVPKLDLAFGRSFRGMDSIHRVIHPSDDVVTENDLSSAGLFDDAWIFQGSATVSFFYNLARGTLNLDAGYAYSRNFDGNDETDQSGFTARLGYSFRL
jgi:hypothetical protein